MNKYLFGFILALFLFISISAISCSKQYELSIAAMGQGSTVPTTGTYSYKEGTSLTVTAIPADGWKFDHWSGDYLGYDPQVTIKMDNIKGLTANFSKITYGLTITWNGNGTTSLPPGQNTFDTGTAVNIKAIPQVGWKFDGWNGDVIGNISPLDLIMDKNKIISANFSKISYSLSLLVTGNGTITPPIGRKSYDFGTEVSITATPALGWKFDGWSGDVSGNNSSLIQYMTGNRSITANFSKIFYSLTLSVNGSGTITPAAGTRLLDSGSEVKINANPAPGWKFDGWSGDVSNSTSSDANLFMYKSMTVAANFSIISLTTSQPIGEIAKIPVSSELVSKKYQWEYNGREWTWELQVPKLLYDYYKALPRSPTKNYSVYVTHPLDDQYIGKLADGIKQSAKRQGFNEYQTISLAAAFVQSLPYTSDSVTTGFDEYPRYPIETLIDNGGDCEDTAILTASLIQALGYGSALVILPGVATSSGHCAVGVKWGENISGSYYNFEGSKYYYLETTGSGWEIGEIPKEYKGVSAKIYTMVPVPILTHDWIINSQGKAFELHVTIKNLGSASAFDAYVNAGFDTGNDTWWNSQKSPSFSLGIDETITANLILTPPVGKHTRLLIKIVYNGYTVDESYSKWFDS